MNAFGDEEIRRYFEEMGGAERLTQFTRDNEFVSKHWTELIKQYPDKWIAVLNGEVIATDDDLEGLIASIPQEQSDSAVVVEFMDTDPKIVILQAA